MAQQDWLDAYLEYCRHQVSPDVYKRWVGLSLLAAAMERRVWLTRGYKTLKAYPGQMMVVLVGKSALDKKTTAIDMGVDLLSHLPKWAVKKSPRRTSPQMLGKLLQRLDDEGLPMRYPEDHPRAGRRVNSSCLIVAGELSVFFSTDNWNETMAANINELNDAKAGLVELEFISHREELWNPIVGMLGGITPKGVAQELPKAARSAGFFGRILWIYYGGPPRGNPLTRPIPENKELEKFLRDGLSRITSMYGPFVYTKQGMAWFEAWYAQEYLPKVTRMEAAGVMDASGYWGRKDAHLLRTAMACSASRSWGTDRWLRVADLERALGFLAEAERGFDAAMAEIGVKTEYTEENQRILRYIEDKGDATPGGWVLKKRIVAFVATFGMRKHAYEDCLSRLCDSGDLEHRWDNGLHLYRRHQGHGSLVRRAMEESEEAPETEKPTAQVIPLRRPGRPRGS